MPNIQPPGTEYFATPDVFFRIYGILSTELKHGKANKRNEWQGPKPD